MNFAEEINMQTLWYLMISVAKQITLIFKQGWQKSGKYSYFPGRREILVFTGKYWEIRLILNLQL
jgi:Ni/Fe-hydrogenase subunit HybB-like protein